jgi:hypothetical protein
MAALFLGRVTHLRRFPQRYRFEHRVFSLLLDVDTIAAEAARLRLLSYRRFNLVSFHPEDHGPRDGSSLRAWAERLIAGRGVRLEGGRIELLCFPRVLGYGFNPLAVWLCHHRDGTLRAVIYEVRNTFGEKHQYLHVAPDGAPLDPARWHRADKRFHVSPFIGPEAEYRFSLAPPGARLRVLIDEHAPAPSGARERMLVATLSAERAPLTDGALLRACLAMPLMTLKVVAAIHWHALGLWLRGAKFFRKPAPPAIEVTPCRELAAPKP